MLVYFLLLDRLDTKNWRPISLLCTDYKILSKVLTNSLKSVLACGVSGHFSGSSIRTLHDIINQCNVHRSGGAIVSLDQEKAVDRVDWGYMQKILQRMNFVPSFYAWVSLLYTDIFSHVLVNCYTSGAFPVTRGLRQGCALLLSSLSWRNHCVRHQEGSKHRWLSSLEWRAC